ncbi:MAG: ABC transporter substrate-binding protein [Desulfovibrionaceae bacterium]
MRIQVLLLTMLLCLAAGAPITLAADPLLAPMKRANGEKWRIGYMEGGHYNDYVPVTKATLAGLEALGWLRVTDTLCVEHAETARELWACLGHGVQSEYLTFPQDAFWSSGWNEAKRVENRETFYERANTTGDIDLMLALGTWAGQDLATNRHHVPTVVCSTSNAVASGIIKSATDSGFDHVHARVDPTRYARQVKLFHDYVSFKRLGIVYENSVEGRSYAGIDQIAPLAREYGFELEACHAPFGGVSLAEAEASVRSCYEYLAPRVDAVYITIHRGVNPTNMEAIIRPLLAHRLPSFAMGTLYEVRYGALMSMAQPDFSYAGEFYAHTVARILHGAKPRDLSQLLEDPQDISINLETAKRIGFHFPLEVIGSARIIHETIEIYKE